MRFAGGVAVTKFFHFSSTQVQLCLTRCGLPLPGQQGLSGQGTADLSEQIIQALLSAKIHFLTVGTD